MSRDEPADVVVRTGPRQPGPPLPGGKIVLAPPPVVGEERSRPAALRRSLFPATVIALVAAGVALFADLSSGARSAVAVAIFTLIAVQYLAYWAYPWVSTAAGRRPQRDQRRRAQYLRYLVGLRDELRDVAQRQRHAVLWRHPDPDRLPALIDERTRVWDHRPDDRDFLISRIAVGPLEISVELVLPRTGPVEDLDRGTAHALRELVRQYSVVPDLPVAVALDGFTVIVVTGDAEAARGLVRALLCQAMVFHGPDHLVIEPVVAPDQLGEWGWLGGAVHAQPVPDGSTPALRIQVVDDDHGPAVPPGPPSGSLQIRVGRAADPDPGPHGVVLDVSPTRVGLRRSTELENVGIPDYLSHGQARDIVRQLSRLRLSPASVVTSET